MLNNAEFAALVRIPVESVANITEDVAPFTMFSLRTKVLRHNGKTATVELWNVTRTSPPNIRKLVEADHEKQKAANYAKYLARGFAFETPEGQEIDD